MVNEIILENQLLAIHIPSNQTFKKSIFFVDEQQPLQVGVFVHPEKKKIELHKHNIFKRSINKTQEVIICRSGVISCKLYPDSRNEFTTILLQAGDILFLMDGWHEFLVVTDCEFIEIKNGPYLGIEDKTRI